MALSESGDFVSPSFHENTNFLPSNFSMFNDADHNSARTAVRDISLSCTSRDYCKSTSLRLNKNGQAKQKMRSALKSKNIAGNGSLKNSTRDLGLFSANEDISSASSCPLYEFEDDQDDSSDNALERKCTQVFRSQQTPEGQSLIKLNKRNKSRQRDDKEMGDKENILNAKNSNKELKLILKTLKHILKSPPVASKDTAELRKLYGIVKDLQVEQEKFRNLIKEQQEQLNISHSRYLQAQNIVQSQKYEIKQLLTTNAQLENELNVNMNSLQEQFRNKIRQVSHLPGAAKADKAKADKLTKDNSSLVSKLQQVKLELAETRAKLEEASHKRIKTLNRLKTSERDLKIFRTQNNVLKTEKRSLFEELTKLKGLNDDLKTVSSKNVCRQRERGETKQRLLRKKIVDLEIELNQRRNSTKVLVEERDKQIADLNMQLSTLVHNFEVSQKHIRILRRHIYSLSGAQVTPAKVA